MPRKLRMLSMFMALLLVFLCIPVAALENVTTGGPMTTQEISGMNASTDNSTNPDGFQEDAILYMDANNNAEMIPTPSNSEVEARIRDVHSDAEIQSSMEKISPTLGKVEYWYDVSEYVVEYGVSEHFADMLVSNNGKLSKDMFSDIYNIYIPIWGKVAEDNRVIGHILIKYDWFREKYRETIEIRNYASEGFASRKYTHFIEDLLSVGNSEYKLLISVAHLTYTPDHKVLLVEKENQLCIMEFQNRELAQGGGTYSLLEYANLLNDRKNDMSAQNGIGGVANNSSQSILKEHNLPKILPVGALIVVVIAGTVVLTICIVKKKSKKNPEESAE